MTWAVQSVPEAFINDYEYVIGTGYYGFTVTSCKEELDPTRMLKFYRRYPIGSFITRNETPFLEWDIVLLRAYVHGVLHVQQSTYICIITRKNYVEVPYTGRDIYVNYESYIIRQVVPENDDIRRVRRNAK